MNEGIFRKKLDVGNGIKPFMVTGVLEKEYEGERSRSQYEKSFDIMLNEACECIGKRKFKEFDSFDICGMNARWKMYEQNAPVYADGHYNVLEVYGLLLVYFELESQQKQDVIIDFCVDRCVIMNNGKRAFDNYDIYSRPQKRVYVFEHQSFPNIERVTLNLNEGLNSIVVICGRVARSTGISFVASLVSAEHEIFARIPLSMDENLRKDIYNSSTKTYMEDDSYIFNETPILNVGGGASDLYKIEVRLDAKEEPCEIENGKVYFKGASYGNHTVKVRWTLPGGEVVTEKEYSFEVVRAVEALPGIDNYEKRRLIALEDLARKGDVLALYRLGRIEDIKPERIKAIAERIIQRRDCSDFYLMPLLWLVFEDRNSGKLKEEIKSDIKRAALSFRYWVDEAGGSSMFYCSENHRIGFHVCEYLAGLLYPNDIFENTLQRGVFHSMKGRMHLVEWLSQRSRMGFDEPHSDNYLPVTFTALLVLREVLPLEEYPLRNMVNSLLDFMTYIFASAMFDGIMATPRSRSYNKQLRTKYSSPASTLAWMLFGASSANAASFYSELAFSDFVPKEEICDIALNVPDGEYIFKQGLMHFDKCNADFSIYRTSDYMLGGVRDHNVGMCDMHFKPGMVALKDDVCIFFSSAQNIAEGTGLRPDYWSGEAHLPRVLNMKRVMAVIYSNVKNLSIWMTHCHFNKRRFDEIVEKCGFTFGKRKNGYVAIWSSVPHSFANEGQYANRELVAHGRECVWVAICGSKDEDGGFEEFINKCINNKPEFKNGLYSLLTPDGEKMEFGLESIFNIDGEEVKTEDYLAKTPNLESKYGSGRFNYHFENGDFTQWTYPACE